MRASNFSNGQFKFSAGDPKRGFREIRGRVETVSIGRLSSRPERTLKHDDSLIVEMHDLDVREQNLMEIVPGAAEIHVATHTYTQTVFLDVFVCIVAVCLICCCRPLPWKSRRFDRFQRDVSTCQLCL